MYEIMNGFKADVKTRNFPKHTNMNSVQIPAAYFCTSTAIKDTI